MIWGDNLDLNKEEEKLIRQYRKESQSKNKDKDSVYKINIKYGNILNYYYNNSIYLYKS